MADANNFINRIHNSEHIGNLGYSQYLRAVINQLVKSLNVKSAIIQDWYKPQLG